MLFAKFQDGPGRERGNVQHILGWNGATWQSLSKYCSCLKRVIQATMRSLRVIVNAYNRKLVSVRPFVKIIVVREEARERERGACCSQQITPTSADNPVLNATVIRHGKARGYIHAAPEDFLPRERVRSIFAPLHAALRDKYTLCVSL